VVRIPDILVSKWMVSLVVYSKLIGMRREGVAKRRNFMKLNKRQTKCGTYLEHTCSKMDGFSCGVFKINWDASIDKTIKMMGVVSL
jgi:hypothetical protein